MSGLRPNEIEALNRPTPGAGNDLGPAPGVIESDRTCVGCGYKLRGLPIGSNCPECGMPTRIPDNIDDPLSQMPVPAIQRLKWGCWSAFWCMVIALVLSAAYYWNTLSDAFALTGLLLLSLSWQVAVRFATPALDLPQARLYGFTRRSRLRLAAQWTQLAWPLAAGLALLVLAVKNPPPQMAYAQDAIRLSMAVGVAGLVALAVVFERLSDWVRDAEAQKYFNGIMWGLPAGVIMLVWEPNLWWLGVVLNLVAYIMFLVYPLAMLMLARSVGLSVHHAIEYELRHERQHERKERFFEKVVEPHAADASAGGHGGRFDEPEEIQLHDPEADKKEPE